MAGAKATERADGMGRARAVRRTIRLLGAGFFLLYLAGLIYFLIFSESYGHGGAGAYDYNVYPFREILRYIKYRKILGMRAVFLNLAGNVLVFLPFGALAPLMARSARRAWRTTLLCFEVSALVELSQLIFQVGCFDVDDIFLNTLGGLLGYGIFCLANKCYGRLETQRACADDGKGESDGEKNGVFF